MDDLKTGGARRVLVAVIDSGIDTSRCGLHSCVRKSTGFTVKDGYIVEDETLPIEHVHATIIASIIKHICPDVEFISINILNSRLTTDGRILIRAMHEALKYKPDILHLSLGTTRWTYKFPIKGMVKQAEKNNILVVSSANNEGFKSYPACIKGVVAVRGEWLEDISRFYYRDGFFHAPYGCAAIPGISEFADTRGGGTSMSAAYVTGHAAAIKYRENLLRNADIIRRLKETAL